MIEATGFEQLWRPLVEAVPPVLLRHLDAERELLATLLRRTHYAGVIEAGCADGRLLRPVVVAAGLRYLGIDIAPDAVAAARAAGADAVCGDIVDLPRLAPSWAPRLTVLPFNLIGILPDPLAALTAVAKADSDVLVLSYRVSGAVAAAREAYFASCGLSGEFHRDELGTHFRAPGYQSSAYHPEVITGWLRRAGFTQQDIPGYGELGQAVHALLASTRQPRPATAALR
jgi:hypothetical protein